MANHEAYKAARTEVEAEAIFNLRMQAQTFLTVSKTTNDVARDRQSRAAGGQAESIISNGGTPGSKQARARGQSGGTTVAEDEKGTSGPWQRVHCLVRRCSCMTRSLSALPLTSLLRMRLHSVAARSESSPLAQVTSISAGGGVPHAHPRMMATIDRLRRKEQREKPLRTV